MNDELFRAIINSSVDCILAFDRKCRFKVWNPAAEDLFGVSQAEAVGKHAFEVLPFLNEIGEDKYFLEALSGKTAIAKDRPYSIPKTGQSGFFESRYSPLHDDSGEVIGGMAIIRDITEQKQLEVELSQRNAELLSLQFAAATITSSLDLNYVLSAVTKEMANMLGLDACAIVEWNQTTNTVTVTAKHGSRGWWDQREFQEVLTLTKFPSFMQALDERRPLQLTISQPNVDPVELSYMQQINLKTLLILPMEFQDRVVGLVELMDDRIEHTFTNEKIALVQMLANQAAIAIENTRLFEETHQRAEQLEALRQVSQDLTILRDIDTLLRQIVECAIQLLGGDIGGIYLYRSEREVLEWTVGFGDTLPPVGLTLSRGEGLSGKVWETGEALAIDDYQNWPGKSPQWVNLPLQSVVGVPIQWGNEFLGVINVGIGRHHPFISDDVRLLSQFANQAAIAIQNARLYAEVKHQAMELATLVETAKVVSSTLDLEEVLVLIAEHIATAIGVSGCAISKWDEEADTVTTWIEWRRQGPEWADTPDNIYALDEFPCTRRVLETSEPITIQVTDPDADPAEVAYMRQKEMVSLLMLPLIVGKRVIGLVELDEEEHEREFTVVEIDLCQALVDQVATAIRNARLFDETRQHVTELEAIRQASLSLTSSLDLEGVLEAILKSVFKLLTGARNAHIFMYEEEVLTVGAALQADGRRGQPLAQPRPHGLTYTVVRRGEPIIVPDMRTHPLYADTPPEWNGTIIGLPLKFGWQVVGVMTASHPQPHAWSETELHTLGLLADQAAVAIDNARLFKAEQQQRQVAEALHRTALALVSTIDLDEVNDRILTELRHVVPYDSASIQLVKEDCMEIISGCGFPNLAELLGLSFQFKGDSPDLLNATVAETKKPLIIADTQVNHAEFFREPHTADNIRSWLGVPMLIGERLIGMVTLDKRQPNFYNETHAHLASAYAAQAAIAIENARLYQQAQQEISERKRTEEALAEERRLLRTLIDNLPDFIFVKDPNSRFIINNIAHAHGLGATTSDEVVGKTDFDIFPQELAAKYYADEQVVIRSGQPLINREEPYIDPAGNKGWLSTTKVPLRDSQSQIVGLVGMSRDITERKQTEAELNAYRERLEALHRLGQTITSRLELDAVLDLIARSTADLLKSDTGVILLLDETRETLSIKGAYGLSQDIIKVTHPRVGERIAGQVVQSGEPIIANDLPHHPHFYNPSTEKEGLLACASVPLIVGESIIGTLDVHSKVDRFAFNEAHIQTLNMLASQAAIAIENARLYEELQKTNDELEMRVQMRTVDLEKAIAEIAEARDRTDAILRSVADGLIVTDLEHRLILTNPAAEALLGFEVDKALGQEIGANIKDDRLREIVQSTMSRKTSGHELDIEFEDPRNGAQRVMRARTALVDDWQGRPLGTVTILQDVTRLRQVDRLKTDLLTTAAHELRTPLTSILGFSEILLERELDQTRRQRYLNMINDQSTHLAEIIDDLLDVSRLESGRNLDLKFELVDMAKLMNEVVVPFAETATEHDIRVEDLAELPLIKGDSFRLAQVGRNLVSNAVKYSPQGGTITIRGRVVPDFLEISIQDEGVGITPEQQKHLFKPFYRANFSNTAIGGTGLGLAICKLIVEQHGGRIWLDSKSGVGTTVYITLPLADDQVREMD